MIERYEQADISAIFSEANKTRLWDVVEVAVMQAYADDGEWPMSDVDTIRQALNDNPVDLDWMKEREAVIRHDLNAYLEERSRHIPAELRHMLHKNMTSYDTEEPAFVGMLNAASAIVRDALGEIEQVLRDQAVRHRHTLMVGRTHGQPAELQTHGKRCWTWLSQLLASRSALESSWNNLEYSKIAGAVGNWGQLHPDIEEKALLRLGLEPFPGATQIMPRELYVPLASALAQTVQTLDKIALDIRLNARPPYPLYQEPFGKQQKGSSAMPQKQNTIKTEQIEGMARMATSLSSGIADNVRTWEERAIEQSCVERVFWPDLFHVTLHTLRTMTTVLRGLVIHRHNMLIEIILGRGCYATAGAKEVLKELTAPYGIDADDAYRIIQLASFNLFEEDMPHLSWPEDYVDAEKQLTEFAANWQPTGQSVTLEQYVLSAKLRPSPQLEASAEKVETWNNILRQVFEDTEARLKWTEVFRVENILCHEVNLAKRIR